MKKSANTSQYTSVFLVLFLIISCKKDIHTEDKSIAKKWETLLPAEIYYSSPALSNDEKTLFIGTSSALFGQHRTGHVFVSLDATTGKERWNLKLGINEIRSSPAVASDKSVYFAVEIRDDVTGLVRGDELWHVSEDGILLWKYNINPGRLTIEVGQSAPAIGYDGTVYVGGDRLYAIRPDGTLRWSAFGSSSESLRNAPAIGKNGTLYFAYHNIPLTAIDPDDGSVIWTCSLGVNDHCFSSPAIGSDGMIYVATQPGLLYAVSPNGNPAWTFDLASAGFSGIFRSSPAVGSDGSVYIGINTGNPSSAFVAINHDGTLKWIFEPADLPEDVSSTHFDIYSSPAIGSDSTIYFGQEFGRIYALSILDGSVISMVETKSGITWSSPAIDSQGVLYISDLSGRVYAYQTRSSGLDPHAAWPKFRCNNLNTGRKI